jgi:hypothetical protein
MLIGLEQGKRATLVAIVGHRVRQENAHANRWEDFTPRGMLLRDSLGFSLNRSELLVIAAGIGLVAVAVFAL